MKEFLISIDETIDVLNSFLTKEKQKELKDYIDFKRGLIAKEFKKVLIEEIKYSDEYEYFEVNGKNISKKDFLLMVEQEEYRSTPTDIGKRLGVEFFFTKNESGKAVICHAWKNL